MFKKKVLSLILAASMVFGSFSMVSAAPATSDIAGHENEAAIERLNDLGIVKGYENGDFQPDANITRAEFAVLLVRALGLESSANLAKGDTQFTDVTVANGYEWATGAVNVASRLGYINGYGDGKFGPADNIRYEDAITLIVRALGYEPAAKDRGGYPVGYLVVAEQELDITDNTDAVAGVAATRGTVFQLLDNSLTEPMMVQVGYGDEKKYEVDEDKTLLSQLGFKKFEGMLVDFDAEELEIEVDGKTLTVEEGFDFTAAHGLELTVWADGSDVVTYELDGTVEYDAVEVTKAEEEVELVQAEDKYELTKDTIVFINGDEEKVKDLEKGDTYNYAKVVVDGDEVVFISAYDLDNSLVIEEVDGTDVFGYDVTADDIELDAEDYVIVKAGSEIALSELEEGDILYYNTDAEFGEVYNENTVSGLVETVYDGEFEVDGDDYVIAGTYVQVGDDIEDIDVLDEEALEAMEDAEESVTVYLTRDGKVTHVVGELGEEDTTTVVGYVTRDVAKLSSVRNDEYALDVVTENGEYVEYNVDEDDFLLDIDGDKTDEYAILDIDKHDLVEITFDEDGDVTEVVKLVDGENTTEESVVTGVDTDDIDTEEDKYTDGGYKLKDSAVVFNVQEYLTNGDDDVDDIEVVKYADVDFDTIKAGTVYADSNDYVKYIAVSETELDVEDYTAVISEVKKLSNGKYRTWIVVEGETKHDDLTTKYNAGDVITLDIAEDGDFSNISVIGDDANGALTITSSRKEEFEVGTAKNLTFADEYVIYDQVEEETIDFEDLEDGFTVEVYFAGNSTRFVEFMVVTNNQGTNKNPGVANYKLTTFNATAATVTGAVYDAQNNNYVIRVTEQGAATATEHASNSLVDAADTQLDFTFGTALGANKTYKIELFEANDPTKILKEFIKYLP